MHGAASALEFTIKERRVFDCHPFNRSTVIDTEGSVELQRVDVYCGAITDVGDRIAITRVVICNEIVACTTRYKLVSPTAAGQCSCSGSLIQYVIAIAAIQVVVAVSTQQCVVAVIASERVVAFTTFDTIVTVMTCLLYTSPSPRDRQKSRMPSSA